MTCSRGPLCFSYGLLRSRNRHRHHCSRQRAPASHLARRCSVLLLLATRNGLLLLQRVPFLRNRNAIEQLLRGACSYQRTSTRPGPTSRAGFRGTCASRPWKDAASEATGADGGNRGPEGRGLDHGHFRRIDVSQMDGVLKIGSAPPSQTNPEMRQVSTRPTGSGAALHPAVLIFCSPAGPPAGFRASARLLPFRGGSRGVRPHATRTPPCPD
jgi:hypothetical protein